MSSTVTVPAGAQLLTLPIPATAVTAGYKNKQYLQQFGFGHFGVDIVSDNQDPTVYAMGSGTVIAAGLDGTAGDYSGLGYVTVIRYDRVYIPGQGKVTDLVATTMHHRPGSIKVKAGDKVTRGQAIADYGNTGGTLVNGNRMGIHLHLQFDSDTKYPTYCYGISARTSKILRAGTVDSTVNPYQVLTRIATGPDRQTSRTRETGWAEDWSGLPIYEELMDGVGPTQEEFDALAAELTNTQQQRDQAIEQRDQALKRASKAETALAAVMAAVDKYRA